jgi:hypothetical protein
MEACQLFPGYVVAANPAGATNLDITVSADGKFLYTNAGFFQQLGRRVASAFELAL